MGKGVRGCILVLGLFGLVGLGGCANNETEASGASLSYWLDVSGELSYPAVLEHQQRFQPAPVNGINLPWSAKPYWFHLSIDRQPWLESDSAQSPRLAILIETEMLSMIEMFQANKPIQRAGNHIAKHEQVIWHRNNVFLVDFDQAQQLDLYFKVKAGTRMNFPVKIMSQQDFAERSFLEYLGLGLFIGAALIMVGYNLILALILLRSPYAYYGLYTLSLTAALALDAGLLQQFGIPRTYAVHTFLYNLPVLAGLLFFRSFLPIKQLAPRFDQAMVIQAWFALFLMVAGSGFNAPGINIPLSTFANLASILCGVISCVGAIAVSLYHGFRPARWLAWAVALTALMLPVTPLVVFGVIPDFPWRLSALRSVVIIELLLFSLGLADLYREQLRERRRDQRKHQEEIGQLMREVHDNIATDIHAAILALPGETKTASNGLLQRALNNARDLASMLSQSQLGSNFSLETGIRQYLNILQQHADKKAEFTFSTQLNLATPTQLQLYRIFQEWMSNCLRHGGAKHFRVEVIQRPGVVLLRIQSDGTRFHWDSRQQDPSIGSGLLNIQHRCSKLNARVRVMAGAHSGCRLVLRMPKQETQS